MARCGIVSKYLYHSDIFGESNAVLNPTMQLLSMQNQGIAEGIKNSASFRFMATLGNFTKPEDLARERKRFAESLFGKDSSGVALFPNTFKDVKQIRVRGQDRGPRTAETVQERVYTYFRAPIQSVVQNATVADEWAAYI